MVEIHYMQEIRRLQIDFDMEKEITEHGLIQTNEYLWETPRGGFASHIGAHGWISWTPKQASGYGSIEDVGKLRGAIQLLWTGFADEDFYLITPQPQPPPLSTRGGLEKFVVVDLLLPQHDPMHTERVPVL